MAVNQDLGLENNDIGISNGDFYFVVADQQHVVDNINAFPGWWKETPADGVGLMNYTKSSSDLQALARSIKINLQADGYSVENPSVTLDENSNLVINPNAIKL